MGKWLLNLRLPRAVALSRENHHTRKWPKVSVSLHGKWGDTGWTEVQGHCTPSVEHGDRQAQP